MDGPPIPPASVRYFFGRITRDRAEEILKNHSFKQGMFLLRESVNKPGDYVLCICHQGKVHHYSIERQYDGKVMIQDGKKFKGPIELIEHHKTNLAGFLTHPTVPCERPPGQQPLAFVNVSVHELEQELIRKATVDMKLKGPQLERALTEQRAKLYTTVTKELHKKQPWFHKNVGRDEAAKRMERDGHETGKFLVRERDQSSLALSISHDFVTKHYIITKRDNVYFIEDGPRFDSLMDLIDHYHGRHDGLLCRLVKPCPCPGYKKTAVVPVPGMEENAAYGSVKSPISPKSFDGASAMNNLSPKNHFPPRSPANLPQSSKRELPLTPDQKLPPHNRPPPAVPVQRPAFFPDEATGGATYVGGEDMNAHNGIYDSVAVQSQTWDDPDKMDSPVLVDAPISPRASSLESQKLYDSVPRTEDVFNLNKDQLKLQEQLGGGQFGTVVKGQYRRNGKDIPVAIKTLKKAEDGQSMAQEQEIMKEAKIMADLNDPHVVRLIGICRASETLMLVLELAPLGPLHKYLKSHQSMKVRAVIELMRQVALGMKYLESVKFVHRDLAARNVLLVSESFAKISDFGMSKAIGVDSNYYKAETAGKWPLKWYAPECIYFFKFDGKSDVWSYGVTLWEAMSYGQKPYKGLKGQQIVKMLEEGVRLEKPDKCPQNVYDVMWKCWLMDKRQRPTFVKLVEMMSAV